MRWCECKKENEPDRNQIAETTKAPRFTPVLFIQGKRPRAHATHRNTQSDKIPPIFAYHSITINSLSFFLQTPFLTPPPVSFPLPSIYHFTSLTSSLFHSIFLRNDTHFFPRHLSVSLYHSSIPSFSQPLYFSFLFFLAPTCCILKRLLHHLSNR